MSGLWKKEYNPRNFLTNNKLLVWFIQTDAGGMDVPLSEHSTEVQWGTAGMPPEDDTEMIRSVESHFKCDFPACHVGIGKQVPCSAGYEGSPCTVTGTCRCKP